MPLGGTNDSPLISAVSAQRANSPSADYPITIGEPYFVDGTEYAPTDTLNYDHVGYAALDAGAMGYSGSHHTLPLPSYVEVTSLESGRTILIRLERRGPMDSNDLLALSPAALAQLGGTVHTPIRVRRVNPPEDQRFLLRAGNAAPLRMDTPSSLLAVLQRRLPENGAASLRAANASWQQGETVETIALAPSEVEEQPTVVASRTEEPAAAMAAPAIAESAAPALPPLDDPGSSPTVSNRASGAFAAAFNGAREAQLGNTWRREAPLETSEAEERDTTPAPLPATRGFVVQAAAFSTEARADRAAEALGGFVIQAGQYWRVRTGPFATRGEAEASLANVRRAGYSDARIQTGG